MYGSDLLPIVFFGVLESKLGHPPGGVLGDKLYALNDPVHDLVLDAGVLALGVLAYRDDVDVIVQGLVSETRLSQ